MLYLNITECKILTGISRLRQTYVLLCYNATVVWACHRKSHISPGNVQCGRLHVKKVHVWLFFSRVNSLPSADRLYFVKMDCASACVRVSRMCMFVVKFFMPISIILRIVVIHSLISFHLN